MAAAWCARQLNLQIQIIVPRTTSLFVIEKLRRLGANVDIHGDVWDEADEYARTLVDNDALYVHPFDHPTLWEGHATLIEEWAKQADKPDALVLSVGGGGLLLGVLEGLEKVGWQDVPVYSVETMGADSMYQSLMAGKPVQLNAITSIATTLGARQVAQAAFDKAVTFGVKPLRVTDIRATSACYSFAATHRVLVEPACGASLAAVMDSLVPGHRVGVVVCGGCGVGPEELRTWPVESIHPLCPL